jgi:hypothetical protein
VSKMNARDLRTLSWAATLHGSQQAYDRLIVAGLLTVNRNITKQGRAVVRRLVQALNEDVGNDP